MIFLLQEKNEQTYAVSDNYSQHSYSQGHENENVADFSSRCSQSPQDANKPNLVENQNQHGSYERYTSHNSHQGQNHRNVCVEQ